VQNHKDDEDDDDDDDDDNSEFFKFQTFKIRENPPSKHNKWRKGADSNHRRRATASQNADAYDPGDATSSSTVARTHCRKTRSGNACACACPGSCDPQKTCSTEDTGDLDPALDLRRHRHGCRWSLRGRRGKCREPA
jgi:hypothetical protein